MVVMLVVKCEVEVDMSRFGDKRETKAETDANCLHRQLGHPIGTTWKVGEMRFHHFHYFYCYWGENIETGERARWDPGP